jgi:SAM-dependent methyltransferase
MSRTADLIAEAVAAPIQGWDFSWMRDRVTIEPLPWHYATSATAALPGAERALDMGTGGGEFLSYLPPAKLTVATEAWPPNVPVAARKLRPLGIPVVASEGARDNWSQDGSESDDGRLPFRDGTFDLVMNRHEAFVAGEVARVLVSGGQFVTQQAGAAPDQFHVLLGLTPPAGQGLDLDRLIGQGRRAGLTVEEARTGVEVMRFADIGAVVFYLRMVPWTVPTFDVDRQKGALEAAAGKEIVIYQERLLLRCRKP